MRTLYHNGNLILPDGIAEDGEMLVEDGVISRIYQKGQTTEKFDNKVDLQGDFLAPGFIDIHVHGGGGGDFMDGTIQSFEKAMKLHQCHGTTALCPTTLTATMQELTQVFETYHEIQKNASAHRMPRLLGMHLEGPYIALAMKGAQDSEFVRTPDDGSAEQLLRCARGALRIWTAAPELCGAREFARTARKQGVLLSIGHSDGRIEDVEQAVEDGYTMVTHLYSSMSTIVRKNGFRCPGILEGALLRDELTVEVIADGMHLPPSLLKLVLKIKGAEKIILVTDAMRAAGMPAGAYKLGSLGRGQEVYSDGCIARLADGTSFAGSVATADRLIKVMYEQVGVPLWQAVRMMTVNPAKALGIENIGALRSGMQADLVRFDRNINIKQVYRDGELVHSTQKVQ